MFCMQNYIQMQMNKSKVYHTSAASGSVALFVVCRFVPVEHNGHTTEVHTIHTTKVESPGR